MFKEVADLKQSLKSDFPDDCDQLLKFCLNEVGFPLCYYHADILADCINAELGEEILSEVRIAYVYLSAYYFLLDSIVDDHAGEDENTLYLTHLLSGALSRFLKLSFTIKPGKSIDIISTLFKKVSENADAIREENKFKSTPFDPNEDDELSNIVGRANSTIFLLEFISSVSEKTISNELKSTIYDFLFFMQLGDDLGDWRIDFNQNHWTSFLRLCFHRLGKIPSDLSILETFVYGSGIYEQRAVKVLKGFDVILSISRENEYFKLFDFVEKQRIRLYVVLKEFINTKLECA